MANKKISAMTAIVAADVDQTNDFLTIIDVSEPAASQNKKMSPLEFLSMDTLKANEIVNFTSGMTAANINTLIAPVPLNTNGFDLTYQFGDGTYTLDTTLDFSNYFGGNLNIFGNTGESGLHSNQAVILNSSAAICIHIANNSGRTIFSNLKVDGSGSNSTHGISIEYNAGAVDCDGNWIVLGTGTSRCFWAIQTAGVSIFNNYLTDGDRGIEAATAAQVQSTNNVTLTTNQEIGLRAASATIFKVSTQPTATTPESEVNGGNIWP